MKRVLSGVVGAALLGCLSPAHTQDHPLDPLTYDEYWQVLNVLDDADHLDVRTRFSLVNLAPPDKDDVWRWTPSRRRMDRRAYALVRQGADTFEAEIDLTRGRLVSWESLIGRQPNFLGQEIGRFAGLIKSNPDFIAAMARRGYDNLSYIDCGVLPPTPVAMNEFEGRRIGFSYCRDVRGLRNQMPRGIENLTVIIDVEAGEVLRVVDEGLVPRSPTRAEYNAIEPRPIAPGRMVITQPDGPGFTRDGNVIAWQGWRFHVRSDQRVGPIFSTVTHGVGEDMRRVLYEGHLSEMFVPYMDPSFWWSHHAVFDAGEYSVGGFTKPLVRDGDCPAHAHYMDGYVATDMGRPSFRADVICIFERETGDMSWRHGTAEPEARRARDLVVRAVAVLGNYDYAIDWVFKQDGAIEIRVGANGIVLTRTFEQEDATQSGDADAYGRFVAPHTVAVHHDHYFSFRLDVDVDGPNNRFVVDRLTTQMLPEDNPRRSVWIDELDYPERESDARYDINRTQPALWRVQSDERRNHVGNPTSYQLAPGMNTSTLLSADDMLRQRAGFIDHQLWVTRYNREEVYAAGRHPTLSAPGLGLPSWSGDEPLQGEDIVLWHTIGMHHLVRSEDWPVMPALWHSFELRPFDFFDENPAIDLPED